MTHRSPILGQFDRDLACAVALSLVEYPHIIANLNALTLLDAGMRPVGTEHDWLRGDDPLDVATREYLAARRDASLASVRRPGQTGWASASAVKTREEANSRARRARDLGRSLLIERGVIAHARRTGLKLIDVD
jgi:hypothetical protein